MFTVTHKIAAMIKLAESTPYGHERDTVMAKVRQLLDIHGMSLLHLSTAAHDDPVGVDMNVHSYHDSEKYYRRVAYMSASYYGCELIWTKRSNWTYDLHVAGRESCRITWTMMYPFLRAGIMEQAKLALKAGEYKTRPRALRAVANALSDRIAQLMHKDRDFKDERMYKGQQMLVPVDLIDMVIEEAFPSLTKYTFQGYTTDVDAIKRAENISLFHQTPSPKNNLRIPKL